MLPDRKVCIVVAPHEADGGIANSRPEQQLLLYFLPEQASGWSFVSACVDHVIYCRGAGLKLVLQF